MIESYESQNAYTQGPVHGTRIDTYTSRKNTGTGRYVLVSEDGWGAGEREAGREGKS